MLGAAYPWVARRLLTDTTPELRSTLLALLYKDGVFNFKRMESLISQAVRPTGRPQPRRSPQAGQSEWRCRWCWCWIAVQRGCLRPIGSLQALLCRQHRLPSHCMQRPPVLPDSFAVSSFPICSLLLLQARCSGEMPWRCCCLQRASLCAE